MRSPGMPRASSSRCSQAWVLSRYSVKMMRRSSFQRPWGRSQVSMWFISSSSCVPYGRPRHPPTAADRRAGRSPAGGSAGGDGCGRCAPPYPNSLRETEANVNLRIDLWDTSLLAAPASTSFTPQDRVEPAVVDELTVEDLDDDEAPDEEGQP